MSFMALPANLSARDEVHEETDSFDSVLEARPITGLLVSFAGCERRQHRTQSGVIMLQSSGQFGQLPPARLSGGDRVERLLWPQSLFGLDPLTRLRQEFQRPLNEVMTAHDTLPPPLKASEASELHA